MEITTYNLHGGSFPPSLGFMRTQDYSVLVGSRRCYEIKVAVVTEGPACPATSHYPLALSLSPNLRMLIDEHD
jgi:hypothetical protein